MYYVIKSGVFKFLVVLLSLILMMVFIPGSYSFAEDASYGEFPVGHLFCDVNGNIIKAQEINGEAYLFLPASADTTKLKLSFGISTGEELFVSGKSGAPEVKVDGSEVDLDSMSVKDNGVYTLNASERKADKTLAAETVKVMKSANVSTVYISSADKSQQGRTYVDSAKDNTAAGKMVMTAADGTAVYNGKLKEIKARGNSTFKYYPKKSYQIKLDEKTALLNGTQKGKTWILLAAYNDPSKMADKVWKDVASYLGEEYAPAEDYADVYYDGQYRGTYMLTEKNQINPNRINITNMEDKYESLNPGYGENETIVKGQNKYGNRIYYTDNLKDPEGYGGFLLELNGNSGDEVNWFKLSSGLAMNVKEPEFASKDAVNYISDYFQGFENSIKAVDKNGNHTGYNSETGLYYYDYCDLDSMVQVYLLNSVASNFDGLWRSCYFYKDVNGKMKAGPVWDMDLTMGTGWTDTSYPDTDLMASSKWGADLMKIPSFRAAVKKYYEEHFVKAQEALTGNATAEKETGISSISARADRLNATVSMDRILWPKMLKNGAPYAEYPGKSYEEYLDSGGEAKFTLWDSGTTNQTITDFRNDWQTKHMNYLNGYFNSMETGTTHVYGDAAPAGNDTHIRKCKLCGETITQKCVYDKKVIAPTRTEKGKMIYTCNACGNQKVETFTLKKGEGITNGDLNYKVVTRDKTMTVTGGKSKKLTTVTVPSTVTYGGIKYRVTAVSPKAFSGYTSLKKMTLGANVDSIGDYAFYKDKNLSYIKIGSKHLSMTSLGKNVFKGINSKAKITVSKSSYRSYLKNKGERRTVRIIVAR